MIDNILSTDETYFTIRTNLALLIPSGASTGKKYDQHFARGIDRVCGAIRPNSSESLDSSFATASGKVPVRITPSLGARWLTLVSTSMPTFCLIGALSIEIAALLAVVGIGMSDVGAQGTFYGRLDETRYPHHRRG